MPNYDFYLYKKNKKKIKKNKKTTTTTTTTTTTIRLLVVTPSTPRDLQHQSQQYNEKLTGC